ncbi:MAG: 30S ribosomal protein S13 [Candidatus Omnitrophica bacterium ADurb.Bin292]|jgi:small subunit ribosomal protein S13|nr:MAG: 30S ribosomal protein S13 [Candidatus Omnitrophica bacterium ADurb.Bin292]HOG24121.1 30S ribosomal protein S13 [Candidatus Omnitrophota bacterium]HPW76625.1 30S ribosomal protein S13 [Candidatus Omnitrophota bacterium]HQB12391.1 30S ribosomal protein S13 [Candidatus Omnitrophota bacterium]
MPRIFGVDIPREKKVEIALTYLYGIGRARSRQVLDEARVDWNKRANDLTESEISAITGIIQKTCRVEGDLRREVQMNIKRLMDIRCYRGVRHVKGLPVRGQRTHTNSRTRKGKRKTVGGLSKKAPAPK